MVVATPIFFNGKWILKSTANLPWGNQTCLIKLVIYHSICNRASGILTNYTLLWFNIPNNLISWRLDLGREGKSELEKEKKATD